MMDLLEQILRAWKEKYPAYSEPNLTFLSQECEAELADMPSISSIIKLHDRAKFNTEEARKRLEEAKFVENYLGDLSVQLENESTCNNNSSDNLDVREGLKKTLSAAATCIAPAVIDSDITRSKSAPHKRYEKVSSDFNSTWMVKLTGTSACFEDDSDNDSDDDENESNKQNDKHSLSSKIGGRHFPTKYNSDNDRKSELYEHTADVLSEHINVSGTQLKTEVDDNNHRNSGSEDGTHHSVHSRILDLERVSSKNKIERKNSERPHVPPKPGKQRLSKPTRKLNQTEDILDRDPGSAEKILQKSAGEPTTAISYQNKGSKNLVNQQYCSNSDKTGDDSRQELSRNEIKSINTVSGEEGRTCRDDPSQQHDMCKPGNSDPEVRYDSGTEHDRVVTIITVGEQDDCGDEMKRFKSRSSSSGDNKVQVTAFKKISSEGQNEVAVKIKDDMNKNTSVSQDDGHNVPSILPASKQRFMEQLRNRNSQESKQSGGKGLAVTLGKSNIFNTSINVLLTQDNTDMVDNSSEEDEEDDNQTNNLDVKPCDNDDGSSVGSENSRTATSTSSTELVNRSSDIDQVSPRHHRKKISTISNISLDSDGVFVPSDDDQIIPDESDGKDNKTDDDSPDRVGYGNLDTDSKNVDPERQKKLEMRKMLLDGILKSEQTYLANLSEMVNFKRRLQVEYTTICSREDITTIFYKVEEICKNHETFVKNLEQTMADWTDEREVGEIFKELIVYLPIYMEYIDNNQQAKECVIRCCQADSDFRRMATNMKVSSAQSDEKELTTLEEILFKPVQRLQRNTLVLHDLLKLTPEDHPDVKTFKQALNLVDHSLKNFGTDVTAKSDEQHHLVKSGFVVEMVGNSRKLRYLFLFSDVVVCTKHKISGRHKVKSFECKWFIPVCEMTVQCIEEKTFQCKEDIGTMKKKIVSLKAELREELKKNDSAKETKWYGNKAQKSIDKLKKRIEEQEASLVLASPHLGVQLKSCGSDECQYTLLLSNDFEREEWKEAIQNQQKQHCRMSSNLQRQMSIHEIQSMITDSKQLPQVNNIGTVLMKKDDEMLSGNLNVTIHTLTGLDECCVTYCQLELDSYGHFFMKAKTGVKDSQEPSWNEDFEMDLDGTQTLRILCYKKSEPSDQLIGRSALELSAKWLKSSFKEEKISMNNIALTISVRHTPASKTLKRSPSKMQGGMFGVKLSTVTRQEGKTVPTIVSTCVKEIESRGIEEVGIYRVSGVTSEIQRLKKTFDKNLNAGKNLVSSCDINAVTGLLKLYFRELPEPLFTDQHYKAFVTTVGLQDQDTKLKCMLQLLHSLPDENYYTIVTMIDHLVLIGKHDKENKMSYSNLSTVFGPTLLHPAVSDTKLTTAEMMQGAQDVFLQADVVQFFLNHVASGKSIRRTAND